MPRKKTNTPIPIKDRQESLPGAERGLWIDPDIWRRIKGEGGRRGVEGLPSTNRYLEYADLALESAKKPIPKPNPKRKTKSRS